MRTFLFGFFGVIVGILCGFCIFFYTPFFRGSEVIISPIDFVFSRPQVIGFLPYGLLKDADPDYSKYISTLTYFGLNVATDGSILKFTNPGESEPGWYALTSGKADSILSTAKHNGVTLSLLVFSGDNDSINELVQDPIPHAKQLIDEVSPVLKKYGFSDLNLDIESTIVASRESQLKFASFVKTVKKELEKHGAISLTIEISPTDLLKHDLIYLRDIEPYADSIVLMAYDFHFPGSYVTGPVAPLAGAGKDLEYDTTAAVSKALAVIPPKKLILGAPLYGYQWETVTNTPHAAIIPHSSTIASNYRAEQTLSNCLNINCTHFDDPETEEAFLSYPDTDTGSYHEIFYPNKNSTEAKIEFAQKNNLGGLAFWALGYEAGTILIPLEGYK